MRYRDRKDYYDFLKKNDIIQQFRGLLEHAGFYIDQNDGKVHSDLHMAWDYTWHHVARTEWQNCYLWNHVMFETIGNFVPSPCMQCFKVVAKPDTVKELFAMLDLMIDLGLPGKCGTERNRIHVPRHYGAYWYNRGIDAGLDCYRTVKIAIEDDPDLRHLLDSVDENGVPTRLILKRGCTEFEHALGRSDFWKPTEEQLEKEALINRVFHRQTNNQLQPDYLLWHIHKEWLDFAWGEAADMTCMEFNGGKPYRPNYVTYHQIAEIEDGRVYATSAG